MNEVVVDAVRLPQTISRASLLESFLERVAAVNFTIRSSITDAELRRLVQMLLSERDIGRSLLPQPSETIEFGIEGESAPSSDAEVLIPLLEDLPQAELDEFRDFYDAIKQGSSSMFRIVPGSPGAG